MKKLITALSIGILVSFAGCDRGTSGGPGASSPPSKSNILGQADDTFSLSVPETKVSQGETQSVSVEIKRGENFGQDVSLELGDLPKGVSIEPKNPILKHGDADATFALTATDDAALGDFTVALTGRPALGAVAVSELKLSVGQPEPTDSERAVADAVEEMRNEYEIAAEKQLDLFAEQFGAMKAQVAVADGQMRMDLDSKCADAETKMAAASTKLDNLKSASDEHWDNCKADVEDAFEALKNVLV